MSLRTFVKISNVTNLSDARYCAGMGVHLLGFNIDPENNNHVPPDIFNQITEWISGVELVGEFETENADSIRETIKKYRINHIQLSHIQLLHIFRKTDLPIILKIDLSNYLDEKQLTDDLNKSKSMVEYFLIEGNNDKITKDIIFSLAADFPLLMGTGISKSNVRELIDNFPIKGISLKGGDEIKPGYKDYDELADILESIEIDDSV